MNINYQNDFECGIFCYETLIYKAESQFGQNDTLARDTLDGTLWPEGQFGQSDLLARDTLARDSLAGETVWPVSLWLVTLWPVTLWPE